MDPESIAHGEDGRPVPATYFDYAAVDLLLRGQSGQEIEELRCDKSCALARDAAIQMLHAVIDWVWQGGPKNANGLEIRSTIVCWVFLPHLAALSLTEIAAVINRDKQSVGRWFDDFKVRFPSIRTAHMRIR